MDQQYLFSPRTSAMMASVVLGLISFVCLCVALYIWLGQGYGTVFHFHGEALMVKREREMTIAGFFLFSILCSVMSDLPDDIHRDALSDK